MLQILSNMLCEHLYYFQVERKQDFEDNIADRKFIEIQEQ